MKPRKKKKKRNRKAVERVRAGAAAMARATHGRKKEQARRACRVKIAEE